MAGIGVADSWAEKNMAYSEQGPCGRAGHKTWDRNDKDRARIECKAAPELRE